MSTLHTNMFQKFLYAEEEFEDKLEQLQERICYQHEALDKAATLYFGLSIIDLLPHKLDAKHRGLYHRLFRGYVREVEDDCAQQIQIPLSVTLIISDYYPWFLRA